MLRIRVRCGRAAAARPARRQLTLVAKPPLGLLGRDDDRRRPPAAPARRARRRSRVLRRARQFAAERAGDDLVEIRRRRRARRRTRARDPRSNGITRSRRGRRRDGAMARLLRMLSFRPLATIVTASQTGSPSTIEHHRTAADAARRPPTPARPAPPATPATMRAVIADGWGGPEVLKERGFPVPSRPDRDRRRRPRRRRQPGRPLLTRQRRLQALGGAAGDRLQGRLRRRHRRRPRRIPAPRRRRESSGCRASRTRPAPTPRSSSPRRVSSRRSRRVSHVEAAALPLVGLTAWQALAEVARVQPGQRVLVTPPAAASATSRCSWRRRSAPR